MTSTEPTDGLHTSHETHLDFTVVLLNEAEENARQEVQVLPDVTVAELLESAVQTFEDHLGLGVSSYVLVTKQEPNKPQPEDLSLGELYEEGITQLVLRRERDLPRKIPCLTLYRDGVPVEKYPLREHKLSIGRLPSADIYITGDNFVSRNAAEVIVQRNEAGESEVFIQRTAARHFKINGREVEKGKSAQLRQGDEVEISAKTVLKFEEIDENKL